MLQLRVVELREDGWASRDAWWSSHSDHSIGNNCGPASRPFSPLRRAREQSRACDVARFILRMVASWGPAAPGARSTRFVYALVDHLPPGAAHHIERLIRKYVRVRRNRRGSLDHLVGAGEQRRWDCQAERFRSLEIDEELHFRRHVVREVIVILRSLKDFVNIACCESTILNKVSRICCKATFSYIFGQGVDRRHSVFFKSLMIKRRLGEIFRGRSYKEGIRTVLSHCCDDAAKFLFPERMV